MNFLKKCHFLPKKLFFLEKWQFDPLLSKAQGQSQGTFFSEVTGNIDIMCILPKHFMVNHF